jgi:hypothetical protein
MNGAPGRATCYLTLYYYISIAYYGITILLLYYYIVYWHGGRDSITVTDVFTSHMVNNNHHVAGKDMCLGFSCIGV